MNVDNPIQHPIRGSLIIIITTTTTTIILIVTRFQPRGGPFQVDEAQD